MKCTKHEYALWHCALSEGANCVSSDRKDSRSCANQRHSGRNPAQSERWGGLEKKDTQKGEWTPKHRHTSQVP